MQVVVHCQRAGRGGKRSAEPVDAVCARPDRGLFAVAGGEVGHGASEWTELLCRRLAQGVPDAPDHGGLERWLAPLRERLGGPAAEASLLYAAAEATGERALLRAVAVGEANLFVFDETARLLAWPWTSAAGARPARLGPGPVGAGEVRQRALPLEPGQTLVLASGALARWLAARLGREGVDWEAWCAGVAAPATWRAWLATERAAGLLLEDCAAVVVRLLPDAAQVAGAMPLALAAPVGPDTPVPRVPPALRVPPVVQPSELQRCPRARAQAALAELVATPGKRAALCRLVADHLRRGAFAQVQTDSRWAFEVADAADPAALTMADLEARHGEPLEPALARLLVDPAVQLIPARLLLAWWWLQLAPGGEYPAEPGAAALMRCACAALARLHPDLLPARASSRFG